MQHEIDLFRRALGSADVQDCFLTTTAPASLEPYHTNGYYKSTEEFLFALAEAMRAEYEMIANAGFTVQVDDAWLAALWDRIGIAMGLDGFRKYCELRVEALNHALRNIPEDRIRYHLCWGSWHGPHAYDLPLRDIVDVLLKVKAQAYLIEGANVRHEHEYRLWEDVKLPRRKDSRAGSGGACDRHHRASRAREPAHPALRQPRRKRECDCRHRLRLRRAHACAEWRGPNYARSAKARRLRPGR